MAFHAAHVSVFEVAASCVRDRNDRDHEMGLCKKHFWSVVTRSVPFCAFGGHHERYMLRLSLPPTYDGNAMFMIRLDLKFID